MVETLSLSSSWCILGRSVARGFLVPLVAVMASLPASLSGLLLHFLLLQYFELALL